MRHRLECGQAAQALQLVEAADQLRLFGFHGKLIQGPVIPGTVAIHAFLQIRRNQVRSNCSIATSGEAAPCGSLLEGAAPGCDRSSVAKH